MILYPIYKYGENNFSLSVVEIPQSYATEQELFSGSFEGLSEFLDRMPVSDEQPLTVLFRLSPEQYKICTLKDAEDFYSKYQNEGYSERGSKENILRLINEIQLAVTKTENRILRPVNGNEAKLLYSDTNTESYPAWVGRLRGDFGYKGKEFWHTWFPQIEELSTQQFKDDLPEIVDMLRKEGPLRDLTTMADYCLQHPEAKISSDIYPSYGFMAETEKHQFCIRCFPYPGDYQFNIYAYNKDRQEMILNQQEPMPDSGMQLKM
jgi:hypothetical protein